MAEQIEVETEQTEHGFRIAKVGITYGRKINLGDYNSANIEYSVWVEIEPGAEDRMNEINKQLWEMAKENVKQQAVPLLAKSGATVRELFLGVPIIKENEDAD